MELQLALVALQEAIKYAPAIADACRELFTKAEPTQEDWDKLRADVAAASYESLVPNSQLPAEAAPAAPVPAVAPVDLLPGEA